MRDILSSYPYLVVEEDSVCEETPARLVGYAYAHAQAPRAAFRWNAELSIYLSQATQGHGLGKRLYLCIIKLLQVQGIKTAFAAITVPNAPSERLHESLGFKPLGVQEKAGYKNGRWHDVAWLTKALASYSAQPSEPRPFPELQLEATQEIQDILRDANAKRLGDACG